MYPRFADLVTEVPQAAVIVKRGVIHFSFSGLLKQFELSNNRYFTQIKYLDSACPL